MNICLYGAASSDIDQSYMDASFRLGKLIAMRGCGMVFGGGKHGLMGAAARGAREAGGEIIGVAPRFFEPDGVLFEHCSSFVFTDTMRERKQRMEELSDAFIVMPGGIGTMEEFLEIFTLRQLGRHRKPIAILNTNGYYDHLRAMLSHACAEGFMKAETVADDLFFMSEPEEAEGFIDGIAGE